MVHTRSVSAYLNLERVARKWFYQPDMEALRACLATVKALDVRTTPVWLMILAPSSSGKTAFYIRCCEAYPRYEMTDEMSIAGLASGRTSNWGDGLLKRLGERGLWLMPDFTVFLNMRDERRNEVMGIQRRLFDGKYDRVAGGEKYHWEGCINVVAACTNALERFHRVNADLGERFLQLRLERKRASDELIRKSHLQHEHWREYQDEILAAARAYLEAASEEQPTISFAMERKVMDWADFISMGRIPTYYNYKDELIGVGMQEGSSRLYQQLVSLSISDAWLMGQPEVALPQIALVERVAMDCLPWARRAVLHWFRTDQSISEAEVRSCSGITHPVTFSKAIKELQAIGAIDIEETLGGRRIRLSAAVKPLLAS